MSAIPPATRSRGNTSRMMPKARGKIAPPSPWITRAPIMTGKLVASAASNVPPGDPGEHDHEHSLLAEHVAETPRYGRSDRRGHEVRREDPCDTGRRRVKILLQCRERGYHEQLQ